MGILRKNQKEMLEKKKRKLTETKNIPNGLISRLGTGNERISELQGILIESSKAGKQREQ